MFRPFKNYNLLYYLALVFMAYPIAGALFLSYPLWTLVPTILFAISYIVLVRIPKTYRKMIAVLWLYSLAYTVYMSCVYNGGFAWFFFFHSNLLVWRFRDRVKSYRAFSYFLALLVTVIGGEIQSASFFERLMVTIIPIFILFMTYSQYRIRIESEMQDELYKKNETINLLAAETERNRIGRDLHDTLGHTFAMMTLKTELALRQLDKENLAAVRKELLDLNQISKESMKNVRELVNNLKYRTVAEELDNITEMFAMSEIDLTIDNQLNLAALSPVIQSSMTMILRELTTNIIKHARASQCHIKLYREDKLIIDVSDDGCGFRQLTGEELHSIKERLQLVMGDVMILSNQDPTLIRVTLEEGGRQ
ncbi:sensor histidine kinase [Streptococcus dentiloxodontae]